MPRPTSITINGMAYAHLSQPLRHPLIFPGANAGRLWRWNSDTRQQHLEFIEQQFILVVIK